MSNNTYNTYKQKKFIECNYQVYSCYDPDEKRTLYFAQAKPNTSFSNKVKVSNSSSLTGLDSRNKAFQFYLNSDIARYFIAHMLHISPKNLTDVQIGFLSERDGILLKRDIYSLKRKYHPTTPITRSLINDEYVEYLSDTALNLDSSYEYVFYAYRRRDYLLRTPLQMMDELDSHQNNV